MKNKPLLILLISMLVFISGCVFKREVKDATINDIEARCASFGEVCPLEERQCEVCGTTKASSYASCHSREFCKNTPYE